MKKFFQTKAMDMTIGQTLGLTVFLVGLSFLPLGIFMAKEKLDEFIENRKEEKESRYLSKEEP